MGRPAQAIVGGMRVVVAPDKFRGSLSAPEAADALARGVFRAEPGAIVNAIPMADGGEGTVEALVIATGGTFQCERVAGPLGEPVLARFGWLGGGGGDGRRTAVIEMAAASGLALVPLGLRDVMRASTWGTGQLVLAALDGGAARIVLGIGGSATNDGGAGLAQALGVRLLDGEGREIGPGGGELGRLERIDRAGLDERVGRVAFEVACDVTNPLCGPNGASAVFGPQKGATAGQVVALDWNLSRLAAIVARDLGVAMHDRPGAGAAGGLGGGLLAFLGGRLGPGVALVIEALGLAGRLDGADLCLTGEGSLDGSTAGGKTAVGVARLARRLGVPTLALAGTIGPGAEAVLLEGVEAYFSLCSRPLTLDEAIGDAAALLEAAAEQAVRAFLAGSRRARLG